MFLFLFAGYCFLLFQDEMSVQALIEACIVDDDKLYWCVSSPTMKDKPVSIFFQFRIRTLPRQHCSFLVVQEMALHAVLEVLLGGSGGINVIPLV